MALVKFANAAIVGVKSSDHKVKTASLKSFASEGGEFNDFRTDDGYVYVRVRAISSRVNKNHDGWPSDELKKSYASFLGKPIFIDHNNHDPGRARGVVVDAKLHVDDDMDKVAKLDPYYASAPGEHLPPTWIELLLETDAKAFPKLAKAIADGDIDAVSMGANVEKSKCSNCGNWASSPEDYCVHVREKGAEHSWRNPKTGSLESKMSYEDCYDIGFFEISYVFDPADETALFMERIGAIIKEGSVKPQWDEGLEAVLAADEQRMAGLMDSLRGRLPGRIQDPTLVTEQERQDPYNHAECKNCGYSPGSIFDAKSGPCPGCGSEDPEKYVNPQFPPGTPRPQPTVTPEQEQQGGYDGGNFNFSHLEDVFAADEQRIAEYNGPWERQQVNPNGSGFRVSPPIAPGQPGGQQIMSPDQIRAEIQRRVQVGEMMPEEAQEMLSRMAKTADTRDLPQAEMTIAPEKVDTLRQETVCPVCGSEMEDGVCEVCNFEEPPEGFGNPDLTKAEDLDDKQEQQGMEAEDAQQQSMDQTEAQGMQPGGPQGQPGPTPAGMPMAASFTFSGSNSQSATTTAGFTASCTTGTTANVTYIPRLGGDVSIEKTAADLQGGRVNTQEKPILPVSRQNSDRPKEQKTISDSRNPVESNNHKEHHHMTDTKKTADGARPNGGADVQPATRVDPDGKGGIGLDPESGIKTVDPLGVGGVDSVTFDSIELDAPVADAIGPHTDTWHGGEGDSAGQQKAVTENEPVLGAKTVKGWPDGLGAAGFETVDLDSPLAEEIGDPTKTFGEDSFHITDPVTNEKFEGDEGVKDEASAGPDRSPFPAEAEGVKSVGDSGPDHSAFPGSDEAVKAARVQWTAALKVAETEVAMGITSPEEKLNRLADLEDEGISALNTRLETLSRVKTAAAKRTARTATTKTGGVPSLKPESAFTRREASNSDSQVDIAESIFA